MPDLRTSLVSVFVFSVAVSVSAQSTPSARSRPKPQPAHQMVNSASRPASDTKSGLSNESLKTDGLQFQGALGAIYRGDFAHVSLQRTGIEFPSLLSSYMASFSTSCFDQLPANKVQVTAKHCATYSQPVNRYGTPVGVRTCAEYERRPIAGQFADPAVFQAELKLEDSSTSNMMGDIFAALKDPDALSSITKKVGNVTGSEIAADSDMKNLVRMNGCRSPALKRLQDNMVRFAEEEEPIRLDGTVPAAVVGTTAKELDLRKLARDLIEADSQNWMFNRFQGGVALEQDPVLDSAGRPKKVYASYENKGLTEARGSVMISFSDGLPACLYFGDAPDTCKRPSENITRAFSDGRYRLAPQPLTSTRATPPPPPPPPAHVTTPAPVPATTRVPTAASAAATPPPSPPAPTVIRDLSWVQPDRAAITQYLEGDSNRLQDVLKAIDLVVQSKNDSSSSLRRQAQDLVAEPRTYYVGACDRTGSKEFCRTASLLSSFDTKFAQDYSKVP